MKKAEKILQIIPAGEPWEAVFEDNGKEVSLPVMCWALVQEEGKDSSYRCVRAICDQDGYGDIEDASNIIALRPAKR